MHHVWHRRVSRSSVAEQERLLPPSLPDWLPENHCAWLSGHVVDPLDRSEIHAVYEKEPRGQPPDDPPMMSKRLVYG